MNQPLKSQPLKFPSRWPLWILGAVLLLLLGLALAYLAQPEALIELGCSSGWGGLPIWV